MHFIVGFCIIGFLVGATVQEGVYDKTMDHVINWDEFHEISETLKNNSGNFSQKSIDKLDEIASYMEKSENKYFSATESIYDWCGEIIPLFEQYMELLNEFDRNKTDAHTAVLKDTLDMGTLKTDIAMISLNISTTQFNILTYHMKTYDRLLAIDNLEDGQRIREYVSTAMDKVKTAKDNMIPESTSIGNFYIQSRETRQCVELNVAAKIVDCGNNLVQQCRAYRRKHGRE